MKVQKFTSLLLAVLMTVPMAACSDGKSASSESSSSSKDTLSSSSGNKSSDSSKEPITLTYWCPVDGGATTLQYISSYAENTAYIEMEKRTGVHIEWIHPAAGQEQEQFNLMIASRDIPDLVGNAEYYRGGPAVAVQDGLFVDISDKLKEYAPNLMNLMDQSDELKKQMYTNDGSFMGFCMITDDSFGTDLTPYEESPYGGPMIRKDYLDELKLDIPETIDEWYAALKAIKESKNPDIVLTIPTNGANESFGTFLSAYGIAPDFYQADGVVKYGRIEDGYRSYLETMNKWYSEGLIDPEFATRDSQSLSSLKDNGQVAAYHQQSPSFISNQKKLNQIWTGAPYPTLEKGKTNPWHFKNNLTRGYYTLISATNPDIERSIEWLDYGYSKEGMNLLSFGIDGVDYNGLNEDGCPNYIENYVTAEGDAAEWTSHRSVFRLHNGTYLKSDKRSNPNRRIVELEKWRDIWGSTPSLYSLPPVTMTLDENTEYSNVMTDVKTYVNEMTIKFIMGTEPLSKFDEYVENIKNMYVEKAVKIQQDALDRYNAK